MKRNKKLLKRAVQLCLLGTFLFACAPAPTVKKESLPEADRIAIEIEGDERKMRDTFGAAEKAFNSGELIKAMSLFDAFVKKYPESDVTDDAYFRMGEISLKNDDTDGALGYFQKILTDHVGSDLVLEARYRLSLAYFSKGEFNDAIQSLKGLLESPLDKRRKIAALATIADAHLNLANAMEALRWYEEAIKEMPEEALEKKIKKRISTVFADRISPEELAMVPALFKEGYVAEYGAYMLIHAMVDDGNYEEAKLEITRFLSETSIDEMKTKGEDLLQVIEQRMDVAANTIGCILPLSGPYAPYGKKVLQGVQLAAGIFGGSAGPPINLVIKDSKGDPEEAVRAVEELVTQDKVVAIVGPLISSVAEAAAQKSQEMGAPMISLSKKFGIPETGDYIFRNFLTNRDQTKSLARYVINELGMKNFAVLYPRDSYGEELMHLFWSDITLLGGKVVGIEGYAPDQYDFGKELKRLVGMDKVNADKEEAKPFEERLKPVIDFDAIFIPDNYERAGLLAPQLVYHDITGVTLLGTNSWNSPKLISIGEKYVKGAVFSSGFYPGSTRQSTVRFVTDFESSFGEKPDTLEAMAYDATKMVVDIIKAGRARSRIEMRDSLLLIEEFEGATGTARMTDSGDVDKNIFILTVKGGEIVETDRRQRPEESEGLQPEEKPLIQQYGQQM